MLNIDIVLKPSKQFLTLMVLVYAMSCSIIFYLPVSPWAMGMLLLGVTGYVVRMIRVYGTLYSNYSIHHLRALTDGQWELISPQGLIIAKLTGDSIVTRFLCLLRFRVPGRMQKCTCLIMQDALDVQQYRRLLVHLRCASIMT